MQIFRQQTSNKLTIGDALRQGWIPSLVFGLSGLFFILVNSSISTLTCQRQIQNRGSCEFRQSGLRGSDVRKIRLDFLHGAEVRSSYSGRSRSYKLFLLTEAGEIPFSTTSSKGKKYSIASQINTFIGNPSANFLEVSEDARLYGLAWGLLFWLFGAAILLFHTEFLICKFDKPRGLITLKQRNIILRTGVLKKTIGEIDSVKIESTDHSGTDRWGRRFNYHKYYIILILKSGEYFRLTQYDTLNLEGKQKIIEYISQYLQTFNRLERQLPQVEQLSPQQAIEKEIATWQEFIRLNPDNAEAHYQLGLALYRHHQHQEATASLQRARDIFKTQGNSQKADVVQGFLWQFGLE
jgi:hypothetical protein